MTKKTLITIAVVSILSSGLVVATNAFAQTPAVGQNPESSLVTEIASKFHLNPSDVQAVFTQNRQEMQAKMESNYQNYLGNLVKEGKITEEQDQLILNKHNELITQMKNNMKNVKSMTPAERQAQMKTNMQDLQTWAKQNNIDLKYLRPFGSGRRGFGKFGMKSITPTPTQ